jgi:hypothetical protein
MVAEIKYLAIKQAVIGKALTKKRPKKAMAEAVKVALLVAARRDGSPHALGGTDGGMGSVAFSHSHSSVIRLPHLDPRR